MLYKQCSKCEYFTPIWRLSCQNCGKKVITIKSIRNFVEKSRLRLAILCIILILFVGLGWFVRSQTGSRWPLFLVFFMVAPLVPWILNLAYKHAHKENEKSINNDLE